MNVIVIGLLRTNLSGLYRHRRGLGFTWSRLQGRKYNIRKAKLVFHAKESPVWTRAEVLSLVSSRFNSPDDVYSPSVRIPPNLGLPQWAQAISGEESVFCRPWFMNYSEEEPALQCRRQYCAPDSSSLKPGSGATEGVLD